MPGSTVLTGIFATTRRPVRLRNKARQQRQNHEQEQAKQPPRRPHPRRAKAGELVLEDAQQPLPVLPAPPRKQIHPRSLQWKVGPPLPASLADKKQVREAARQVEVRAGGGGGGGFFGGGGRGPLVDPGEYKITVAAGGQTVSKPLTVEQDPRVNMPAEVIAQRRDAITKLYGMAHEADEGRRKIVALRTSLTTLTDSWKRPGAPPIPDAVKKQAESMLANAKEVVATFEVQREGPLGDAGPPLKWTPPPVNQKLGRLMNSIDSYTGPPTARQLADLDADSHDLQQGMTAVNKLVNEDLPRLNKMMAEAGVPYVTVDTAAPPNGQGRRGN